MTQKQTYTGHKCIQTVLSSIVVHVIMGIRHINYNYNFQFLYIHYVGPVKNTHQPVDVVKVSNIYALFKIVAFMSVSTEVS